MSKQFEKKNTDNSGLAATTIQTVSYAYTLYSYAIFRCFELELKT